MQLALQKVNAFLYNQFLFSGRYRTARHLMYWIFHVLLWSAFWVVMGAKTSFARNLFNMSLWVPVFILFGYPLAYWAVPKLLLKEKFWQFTLLIIAWGVAGLFLNAGFRTYLYVPLQQAMGFEFIPSPGVQPHSYLCMTTSAASPMLVRVYKLWTEQQQAWLHAQQKKTEAQLQLLKSQLHPHFLFNTLNNIYAFALEGSAKTPQLIAKLSSLLTYMLHDCKAEAVLLEQELAVLQNYIGLEKERYGDRVAIDLKFEGAIKDKYIAPLLLLPFLENAFKHGLSEQLRQPKLHIHISVTNYLLHCKVVNSKNDDVPVRTNGVGIQNIRQRLQLLYPAKHELSLTNEKNYFEVALKLQLQQPATERHKHYSPNTKPLLYEAALPAH